MHTVKKNTETLLLLLQEDGLEVKTEKTKYMFLSHKQDTREDHDLNITNEVFENVTEFRYL